MKFVNDLTNWYSENKRDLPWRKTKDPYSIWVCEIIFQQTKISQGTDYYRRFKIKFPTLKSLSDANENDILKAWEGLGYYTRARNLHFSAKYISAELNGVFPKTYNSLLTLKGVGKYTAAAIASICFNEKVAAIDGNALRVYSRLFNSFKDIGLSTTLNYFFKKVSNFIPQNSGDYNQAIMELGALICTPKNPKCITCPINKHCIAYKKNTQTILPVKKKMVKIKKESFNYYLIYTSSYLIIKQRNYNGIWKHLYELISENVINKNVKLHKTITHKLTHKNLTINFYSYKATPSQIDLLTASCKGIKIYWKDLNKFTFPIPIKNYLSNYKEFIIFEKNL